jgi:hypothetical protein
MCVRRVCMAVAVLACVVSSAPGMSGVGFASDRSPGPAANVFRVSDGELVASIERAVVGARRRLEEDRCAAVLGDFADAGGRILTAVAAEHGKPPADLLSRIIFRDGRDSVVCRGTSVVAFTGAGSRVVFVCAARFSRLARDTSELVIIHELLHTLGLGERPPSSRQIDNAVARRCHT